MHLPGLGRSVELWTLVMFLVVVFHCRMHGNLVVSVEVGEILTQQAIHSV